MDDIKDKIKDKKFQINILIYAVIFMAVIFLLNWLVKSVKIANEKNQVENFSDYYKGLLAKCDNQSGEAYNCCLDSVKNMAGNNYAPASGLSCNPGFKINTFACLGSYKWCEMIR